MPYIQPEAPTIASRNDVSTQTTRHMKLLATRQQLPSAYQNLLLQTVSRAKNFLLERRSEHDFKGWGIVPLRFGSFVIEDLAKYAEVKDTLNTTVGLHAVKRACRDSQSVPAGSPYHGVVEDYLTSIGAPRTSGFAVTLLDGPTAGRTDEVTIKSIVDMARGLTPINLGKLLEQLNLLK